MAEKSITPPLPSVMMGCSVSALISVKLVMAASVVG